LVAKVHDNKKVVCAGAATIDVKARPSHDIPHGSTAGGTIYISPGGVARNMAESFARLGCESYLLSMTGIDLFGDLILKETSKSGAHIEFVEKHPAKSTASYTAILDTEGVTQYAVFDGLIIEEISPDFFERRVELLMAADLLVANTNLRQESLIFLSHLSKENGIPLYVNATSTPLARRVFPIIEKISVLGASDREAEALVGFTVSSPTKAIKAAKHLVSAGVGEVLITLGSDGVVYCSSSYTSYREAFPAQVVETTGAGDACLAGFLFYRLHGYDVERSLEFGLAAAALTVETRHTVSPSLSPSALENAYSDENVHGFRPCRPPVGAKRR